MKPLKTLFLLVYLLIVSEHVVAQYPFSKKMDVEEENLTLKANVLLRDRHGFLWIGTSEGIFKYSATVPEKIYPGNKEKLYITSMYEDAGGIIWAGCKNGNILKIEDHRIAGFTMGQAQTRSAITAFWQDAYKRMWFATAGEGIFWYDGNRLHHIGTAEGLSDNNVNCIYSPDGKRIIAGTDRGLSFIHFENGQTEVHFFTSKKGLPDNIITCIAESGQRNIILAGMQSKGILLFNIDEEKIVDGFGITSWPYSQVNDILELRNEIIIATEQKGLVKYDKLTSRFTDRVLRDSIFPKRVADLQKDNEGNIWAASENKLVSFTGDYLRYWYSVQGVNFTKVHTLFAEDDGKLWFTPDLRLYEGGLDDMEKGFLKSYDLTPPEDHIDITGLYRDRLGYLWIGTMGEGLFRMNIETGRWRRIKENPIAYYGNILNITGKGNQVWISTLNGVCRFMLKESNYDIDEKIEFTNYTKKDGLGSDYIYYILIDSKERVWFATDGAGVAIFENGMFQNFYAHGIFPSKVTYSLAEDRNGHIWISTYNEGLFEYDGTKFIQYGIKNGLTDLAITSIATDDFNNIIAVNKKGFDVFSPTRNVTQHFGTESGFSELQPNLNSITKDRQGNIWIGTDNGIVRLNTRSSFSVYIPAARIESVSVFNISIDTNKKSAFAYDQNNFSFKLAAPFYKAPEKIKFQYWLEGYSKKWETTGDRVINFPHLNPGYYTMRVRASASENFESSPITSYSFTIAKAFWNTWWFKLLAIALVTLVIYGIVIRRIRRIRYAEQAELEKFQLQYDALKNQVNPHFLFNSFNALMNIVEDNPKEASELIAHLAKFYRKITAYSQKELITIEEELDLLNSYLFIQNKRYGNALQVLIDIDPGLRRSTFIPPLVLQLLTENAVKHNIISKEKVLHISIFSEPGQIIIKNNINPKLEKEESEGVGLRNIRNRYKLLTNKEIMQEAENNEFTVRLPAIYAD